MNSKKQFKVPGFIIAIAIIIVLAIIFLITVQVRFMQNYDDYQTKHESATSKINYYNSYLARASDIEASIAEMIEEYQTKNPILYSNATTSPKEIRTMLKNLKYDIDSLSISTGVLDELGRSTVEGGRLYYTSINFKFSGTRDDLKKTLDYLELKASGAYYINSISIEPVTEDGTEETSAVVKSGQNADYDFNIQMGLYYFEKVDIDALAASASAAAAASAQSSAS